MQITLPRTHVGRRKVDKLGRTQKTPTDKSAMAKLPRKKFVIDRRRGLRQIANSTIRFPETGHTYIYTCRCICITSNIRHTYTCRCICFTSNIRHTYTCRCICFTSYIRHTYTCRCICFTSYIRHTYTCKCTCFTSNILNNHICWRRTEVRAYYGMGIYFS